MTRSLLLWFITLLNLSLPVRCETPAVSGDKKKYRPLSGSMCAVKCQRETSIIWEDAVYISAKHEKSTNMSLIMSHDPVLI